jgi:hypothetical protein
MPSTSTQPMDEPTSFFSPSLGQNLDLSIHDPNFPVMLADDWLIDYFVFPGLPPYMASLNGNGDSHLKMLRSTALIWIGSLKKRPDSIIL